MLGCGSGVLDETLVYYYFRMGNWRGQSMQDILMFKFVFLFSLFDAWIRPNRLLCSSPAITPRLLLERAGFEIFLGWLVE